jgi:hypothetical protein
MVGGLVLEGLLWAVAAAMAVWVVGPTVAILLGRRRIDVDVYPEPPLAKPYPEDADGLRRYEAFLELGFRPIGWTSEHARFLTPLHWRWRSREGCRWLAAPDGCTFACIYRVRSDEPVRFGAMTLLDGDGSWATYYPGVGLKAGPVGNRGRGEVQGVEPAGLLEAHAKNVERFRGERGLAPRRGTLADVAAASLAFTRAHFAPRSQSTGTSSLALGLFALPVAMLAPRLVSANERARIFLAGAFIFLGLLYAALRASILRSSVHARHTHTREFAREQAGEPPADRTITAGRYERWVRGLAVVVVLDMVARLAFIAWKSVVIVKAGAIAIFFIALIVYLCVLNLRCFVPRSVGRARTSPPNDFWFNWALVAWMFNLASRSGYDTPHVAWLIGVCALAFLGRRLEKAGGA